MMKLPTQEMVVFLMAACLYTTAAAMAMMQLRSKKETVTRFMAGLVCAYLDSEDANVSVKAAFNHALETIREEENIAAAFQTLEKALMDDEESIRMMLTI